MFQQYLSYLELPLTLPLNYQSLCLLQCAHLKKIPWENLNIYFGKPISLDSNKIINKFISESRGGICYELNGAYHHLLKYLGFDVILVEATLFGNEDKIYVKPRKTHIVNLVTLGDETYLSDVAWDYNITPLSLACDNGIYRVVNKNNYYQLNKKIGDQWYLQYELSCKPVELTELTHCVDYTGVEKDPEREVLNHLLFRKFTNDGSIFLIDNKLKIIKNSIAQESFIENMGGLNHVLNNVFGVHYRRQVPIIGE